MSLASQSRAILVSLTMSMLIAPTSNAQHNVPANQQDGMNDCGTAAAASCLKWFDENGYPDIKDASGNDATKDLEKQMETDAKTGENGTWADKLADAMNKLVDGTNHKGQLRARLPSSRTVYQNFTYLDDEFSHNEDILLLISWTDEDGNKISHYVTVKNVTGTGATRTVEYMDPATGTFKSGTMDLQGGRLFLAHDGNNAKVSGFVTMSPANTTTTTAAPVDPQDSSKGTTITYTSYFPSFRPTKDLHIWVSDCTKSNYAVSGLPTGWSWNVVQQTVNGKLRCYLSFWKGSGTGNLSNGGSITVTYTGPKKVKVGSRAITTTTNGTASVTDSPQPTQSGHSVLAANLDDPLERPASMTLGISNVSSSSVTASLAWSAETDPAFSHYEVYDANSGELIAETESPSLVLPGLEPDVLHSFVVASRNIDVALSEDSDRVGVYLDVDSAPSLSAGTTPIVEYVSPLFSSDEPVPMEISLPEVLTSGSLYVSTLLGEPATPLPAQFTSPHYEYYHIETDATLAAGTVALVVPYDTAQVVGSESDLRVLGLYGGNWIDLTTMSDPVNNTLLAIAPDLSTFIVVNGATPMPSASTWGLLLLASAVAVVGSVFAWNRAWSPSTPA